jgi:hypothetical protein
MVTLEMPQYVFSNCHPGANPASSNAKSRISYEACTHRVVAKSPQMLSQYIAHEGLFGLALNMNE